MLIRNGKNAFKITKYLKRMLLIIIPVPCDGEFFSETERIDQNQDILEKNCGDDHSFSI
jgi:hypothetical protein